MSEDSPNSPAAQSHSFDSHPGPGARPHSRADDALLLERVRSGDQKARGDLFDRYGSMVYSVAMRVLKDPGSAEDIMQEIFLQVWQSSRAFDVARGSLAAWLLVITRNRAVDLLRRRHPSDSVDDVVLPARTDVAGEAERHTMMEKVRSALHRLPAEQQQMVELAFFDGLSHSEIAQQTGDPLGTVKTRIRAALISVRKALQP